MEIKEELEALKAAGIDLLRRQRPADPPVLFPLVHLTDYIEDRHMTLFREAGFPDARRAFNAVFIHLPADGCRLTELAERANMTKQAMGELVDELVRLKYLVRFPDPSDKRAKIILRAKRGLEAHTATMKIFAQIDEELAGLIGSVIFGRLRDELLGLEQAVTAKAVSDAGAENS